jgi:hypothetical protein
MTIITRNPQVAINRAIKLEQRGFAVSMEARGTLIFITAARIVRTAA